MVYEAPEKAARKTDRDGSPSTHEPGRSDANSVLANALHRVDEAHRQPGQDVVAAFQNYV